MFRQIPGSIGNRFKPSFVLCLILVMFPAVAGIITHSQSQQPPTIIGRTQTVALVPFGSVNAGPFIFSVDSDHDGMPDDAELQNGTDPNNPLDADADPDGDGLTNGDEVALGTNPNSTDSDGDGISDGEEVRQGYDPLDATSTPPQGVQLTSIRVAPASLGLSINAIIGSIPAQLTVTGMLNNGQTIDLTRNPATSFESLDLDVAVVDDRGTVVGVNPGISTIRVRNTSLTAQATVVVTNYAPEPLTSLQIPGYANNVDAAGDFAYVAAGSAGLQVVDVSNHSAPFIAGSLDTPGNANDVQVIGNLVFIADGSAGLNIIDVTNPVVPVSLGTVDTPGEAQDVVVANGRAYVADGEAGLQVIDVTNPATPVILGSLNTPLVARGVDVSGFYAVVADDGFPGAIRIVDISNPALPVLTGDVRLQFGAAKDVVVRNQLAYVAGNAGGLQIVDFNVPASPVVVGLLPPGTPGGVAPRDVELSRDFAFVAEEVFVNAVPTISIVNPANPTYTGLVDFASLGDYSGTGIALDSQFVYLTGEHMVVTVDNGVSGNTRLFIGQYLQGDDTENLPPVVEITSPTDGQSVVSGDFVTIRVTATDDVLVGGVEFQANGTLIGRDTRPPFQMSYEIPAGETSILIESRAFDLAGNIGEAVPVTLEIIPDPLTTVIGRVVDVNQTPVSGATVQISDTFQSTFTNDQGMFMFTNVETVPFDSLISVSVLLPNGERAVSSSLARVRGGITDLGDIVQVPVGLEFVVPRPGMQLVSGEELFLYINPLEGSTFGSVNFFADRFRLGGSQESPFQLNFRVPNEVGSTIEFQALGVDQNGILRNAAPVNTQIVATDPLTTVIGRAVDSNETPIANAFVTIVGTTQTARTDDQGRFIIPDVGTIPLSTPIQLSIADATGNQSGQVSALPVRGGTTDFGDIPLARTGS